MSEATELATTFEGRTDIYGHAGDKPYCVKEPLTPTVWAAHLRWGKQHAIGVYNRTDDGFVHWGCSDFDDPYGAVEQSMLVHRALRALEVPSHLEISRSGKRHLWVFLRPGEWTIAANMRRTLLMAHHLADVKPTEVNPKAEGGNLGNFVRVPYPEHGMHGRQVMLSPSVGSPLGVRAFLDTLQYTDGLRLQVIAEVWTKTVHVEQERKHVEVVPYDGSLDDVVAKLKHPAAKPLFLDGPLDGDRSRGLYRLVKDAHESSLTPGEAYALLADADARWGKYQAEERSEELGRLIQKVYQ